MLTNKSTMGLLFASHEANSHSWTHLNVFPIGTTRKHSEYGEKDPEIDKNKPAPYPWRTRRYTWWHTLLHLDYPTVDRFDENSKITCVEGEQIVVEAWSSQLRCERVRNVCTCLNPIWWTVHQPPCFDYRSLITCCLKSASCRWEDVLSQSETQALFHFQFHIFMSRWHQYIDALEHLYSTGQGVS